MATAVPDTFDIAGQQEAQERARDKARLREKLDIEDLKWVMQNRRGRRFVHSILERSGAMRLSFHTNALTMAFNEGTRNEGLALTGRLMQHCTDLYMTMLKEHSDDE